MILFQSLDLAQIEAIVKEIEQEKEAGMNYLTQMCGAR